MSTFSLNIQIFGSTFPVTIYVYRFFILTSSWSTSCSSRFMRVSESWMACSWQEPMWSSSSSTSVICCISTIFCNRMEFHLLAFCCVQLVRNCLYHFPSLPEGEETNLPPGAFKVSCYLCCFLPIVSHCLMGTGKKGFHLSRSLSMLSQTRIKYLHTQSLNFALKCTWIVKVNGLF